MTPRLVRIHTDSLPAERGAPDPLKVRSGSPVHTSWNAEDSGDGLYAGIWQSTPGEWEVSYTEWEFCHIIEGVSVLAEAGGETMRLQAGDSCIIRPGFKGTWTVIETTRKHYVIRT